MANSAVQQVFAFPASFAQERLWLLAQMEASDPAYHITGAVRFRGDLNLHALQASLNGVVKRQESLRTTFREVNGEIEQIISPSSTIDLEVVSAEIRHAADAESSFDSWLATILEKPFDLVRGPLLRVALWKHKCDEHTMILVVHHIVADGWSLMVLIREVTELYRAFVAKTAPRLPTLSIQYADYTLWQRKWVSEQKLEADLSYWKSRLDDLPVVDLPTDYWRPSTQQHRGGRQSLRLSSALSAALIEFSQREQTTLFITLLTGFKVLLHRYSGSQDVVVGTPVAGRKRCELEPLIGCFLNTLVLRTEIPENASFRQVLRQVRETALDAYSHEDTPFEKVVEAVNPQRTFGRSSLFQVFVNMLSLPEPMVVELPGVKAEMVELPEGSSKFDLTLYIYFQQGEIDLSLVYNAGLFLPERIEEIAWQFQYLLEQAVQCPEERISEFSLVGPQTRLVAPDPRALLDSKFEGAVHELFRAWAESNPHQLAVADPDVNWSYLQLDGLSNRLANYLLSIGIRRGDVIAIYAHRSAPLVVALLGIMKAGGAFLILDPYYPTARLVGYLQSAKPKALLELEAAGTVPAELKEWAGTSDCQRFMLRSSSRRGFDRVLQDFPAAAPAVSVGADDLACISFTSGSTGIPKGVMGCHGSLSHFTPWTAERFGLRQSDRFSMFSGLSHDPLQRDIFTPLMIGASVFIPHPEDWKLPGKAVEWMRQNEISVSNLTPSLSQLITYENTKCSLDSLRYFFFVGEALSLHDVSRLCELAPRAKCVNYFGTTETQRALSFFEIPCSTISSNGAEVFRAKDTIPLGRGIKDVQLLVLNKAQQLAGIGELGEIYIRSPHLAHGYLEDPKLSAVKFLLNPFTGIDGDRVYRTGDLGRYLPDGSVEFAERDDGQVKVRGFRVELGEIEARLRSHPLVRATAVALREHPSGSKQIVGYVVLDQEQAGWQSTLHMWLAEQLPDYMVPSTFVMMDGLPLTPTGKVDRRALPAPSDEDREGEQRTSSRNVEEEILQLIFAGVLKLERVGLEQSFFQAGGHSLLATRVMSRIRSTMGVEIPLRALFESPTVVGLAKWLRRARRTGLGLAQPPLVPVDRGKVLPLSYAQQRLWFLHRFTPRSVAYNMPFGLKLKGELNREGLRWSFDELIKRHEVLRTVFVEGEGGPVQAIADEMNLGIEDIDLRGVEEGERATEAERLLREDVGRPFDLGRGPLLRVKLLRLGEQEHELLVTVHHIVFDGWSIEIMVREIAHFYEAYVKGEKPDLPELQVQYADYAMWQRRWLQGEALEQQLGYWKKQLEGVEVLELPANRRTGRLETEAGKSVSWSFPEELGMALMRLGRSQSATVFMTLLAGFQVLLSRYSGQKDISVGTPIAGRTRTEMEGLIGFFVNTLVMRTELKGRPSFLEVLDGVREMTLAAYTHQDLPFEKLVEELQPERNVSGTPLFQVMFILQNLPLPELELPRLKVSNLNVASQTEKFELTLVAMEHRGRIHGQIRYREDLFEEASMRRLLVHWENLLTEIVTDAGKLVAELQLLTLVERQQLLVEWNRTEDCSVVDQCVQELFVEQVRRMPDAVAVVCEGERVTYGELNRRTNQLARYLRRMGVGADKRVGLCLGRGINMVAGLVAIWKAGGAYVPIDAGYPRERVAYILNDAGCEVVVTERGLWRGLWGEEESGSGKWKKRVLSLDEEWEEIRKEKDKAVEGERGDAENLAYVIYTSGSTGKPKGVEVEHRQLMNYLVSMLKKLEMREGSSYATVSTLAADLGNTMIFPALTSGGTLHVITEDRILDGERLGDYFEEEGIECLKIVPSHLMGLQRGGGGKRVLPQKILVVGGEASYWEWVKRWKEEGRGCRVINHYGPTETTVGVLTCELEAGATEGRGREENVPLGRPLDNTQAFVLDEEMEPVPVGVAGELYIGGAGLARGYTGKGDMTGERFVPNPFSDLGGKRLYRTGDRVKWQRDGELEFLGRRDCQVKLRGYRIELGEVEGVLGGHRDVEQAAVVVSLEGGTGEKTLIGYVVLKGKEGRGGNLTGKEGIVELRNYLKERLPEYMVPGAIVVLDEIPVTRNGKVDRTALPKLAAGAEAETEEAISRDAQQEILSGIFAEVLKREKVGVEENFFEIGGHSLLATLVMSRVRKVFGVEIPLRALFESPTVKGLADRVMQARRGEEAPGLPLVPTERSGDLPLSYAQQRLWFVDQLEPGRTTYNVLYGLRLTGDLDWPALKWSIQEMVRRHEILRTRFPERYGIPVQEIAAEGWQIKEIDLRVVAEEQRAAKAELLAQKEVAVPFDLAKGPLLRVTLLRLGTDEHVLLVTMHHIVSDEWSRGVIVREICLLYQAYVKGEESPLPDLEIQYADFASWQQRWLQGEVLERQMKYWKRQLANLPVLNLPTDRTRPAVMRHGGGKMSFELPRHLTDQLKALGRREGVTLFMTLLAAFQVLLQKYTGQHDIAIGNLVANRDRAETQALIGFFANIVVLRVDLSGRPSFADVLGRVREVTLEAFEHQDLPFEMVVNAIRSQKASGGPLVQAVFSMHRVSAASLQLTGLQTRAFELNYQNDSKFDLLLHIEDSNEDLRGKWEYSIDLFESETIEQMSRHFLQLISKILQDPSTSIDDLQLLSQHEVQLLSQTTEKDEFVSSDFSF